jgi:hypothetical protein
MGIAVFSENATLLAHAADMWRQRTPAYFYNIADGNWVRQRQKQRAVQRRVLIAMLLSHFFLFYSNCSTSHCPGDRTRPRGTIKPCSMLPRTVRSFMCVPPLDRSFPFGCCSVPFRVYLLQACVRKPAATLDTCRWDSAHALTRQKQRAYKESTYMGSRWEE